MLLVNATLVNWTPREVTPDRALLIRDGKIIEIGKTSELREKYPAEEARDCKGRYVLPGNICAHTHFYGAYARGMNIPGKPARDFPEILRRLWWPLDKALTAESVRHSALVCLVDAIKHGTTTLFDHHASPNAITGSLDVIADAVEKAGLRAVLCYEVTDRDGIEKAEAGIAENQRFLRTERPNVRGIFGLHASMTLSNATLRKCVDAAEGSGFHIHVAEHEADEEDSILNHGAPVVTRLQGFGMLGEDSIVAHCVHIDPWEMETLRLTRTWITHQPRSNMNNGVGTMRFDTMMRGDLHVCLGNDGFSNDMWAEWKTAYLLHKASTRDPRKANGADIAKMATGNNAQLASRFFEQEIGVLAPGNAADLIVLDYHPYTPLTADNLTWHALFGFESSMCVATMCAGKLLMWDRVLLTLDETKIAAEAHAHAPEVWARYAANVAAVLNS
jgi:putative selenium metabolism protein SsnA